VTAISASGAGSAERRQHGWWLAGMVVLLGVAFFLRACRLDTVPFGWHPDEAVKGLLALDILAGRDLSIFFPSWTGREALYPYLEAAAFALFGPGMFAARLLSAFVGMLTVAGTYALGRQMFNRRVALLAAALAAVSLWHVIASRNGYRAVIQPLIQWPALWFFFRGLRTEPGRGWSSRRYFVLAGVFLGLTQYTYTAARAFPVLMLVLVMLGLVFARREVAPHWRSLLLMFLTALAVFAPLGWYFLRQPDAFLARAAQVSVFAPQWAGGDPWGQLWQSVRDTAGMFTVRGDPNFRFNLGGRPVYEQVTGVLFYLGLLVCLWQSVKARGLRRLAHLSLLAWLVLLLLPMTLSAEGLPYYQRAIGILPAVYYFPGLALDAGLSRVGPLVGVRRRPAFAIGVGVLFLACFGLLAARTYRDYFVGWQGSLLNDDHRRVGMAYVAEYVRREQPAGELYISTEFVEHPTLAFLGGQTGEQFARIHWFDGRQGLALPAPNADATYIVLSETPVSPDLLARTPGLRHEYTGRDRFQRPVFDAYRWEAGSWPEPTNRSATWAWELNAQPGDPAGERRELEVPVDFGGVISFEGHDLPGEQFRAGDTLPLVLYWRPQTRPGREFIFFSHLVDAEGRKVGQYDGTPYSSRFWRREGDELLLSTMPIQVAPGTPAGEYYLVIGAYDLLTGERLRINAYGTQISDWLLVATVKVR
jgi:4-amino-4-deoxy-L-arabinose transferase-like glycosyltransferase